MNTADVQEWWQQGLFEWRREALKGHQELVKLRAERQALRLRYKGCWRR